MAHAHVHRLHHQVVQSIETSSLHLELIADMKRLNSLFCSSAYAALESHEHGTLADGDDDHPEAAEQHATELDSHEAKPAAR
jgi:phosphate:Na+ symporter